MLRGSIESYVYSLNNKLHEEIKKILVYNKNLLSLSHKISKTKDKQKKYILTNFYNKYI